MTEQDFVIKDKRRFTADGETRPEVEEGGDAGKTASTREQASKETGAECGGPPPLPEVNFATFVFSLGTSALVNLGELPDPHTNQSCQNLPVAKQTIDILIMLQDKTKGNLTPEEENLLRSLLYELRMKYVTKTK
ncbi:MAG: DUF1844 domain-containing protein [Thermodesulfobacteriota bacterium]